MKNYDLIVVGAGFAGLACAESAARKNLNTLILERKYDIGKNIHTTGILVKEVAEEWDVPDRLVRRINGVRLYSPSLDCLDLTSPDYYFLATDTPGLLRWHAKQAVAAGAKINFESKYSCSSFVNKLHHFEKLQLQSRFLVGCDGARSNVAQYYNLGRNRHFLIGVEAEYEVIDNLDDDKLHVFLDSELAPGYIAWIVPGVNCTQIGLATSFPKAPQLKKFIEKISPLFNLKNKNPFSHRAGLIPCGGLVKNFSNDNVLLVGDAAGMVSPLTAGGIHPAIQVGKIAGNAIFEYLNHEGDIPGKSIQQSLPEYSYKNNLRRISDRITIPNSIYDLMLQTPIFRSLAQTIFFHHRGLFSPNAWRDLVRVIWNYPLKD